MEDVKIINEVPNKITITVIGNRFSGKTTLLNSLIFPKIIVSPNYIRTYGYDIRFLQINDNIIIKFFDIGDLDIESNEKVFQELSWYSHYVLYIIEPKINESIKYLKIFEDVFQKNQKILVFNKIDGINSIDFFNNNSKVQKFIKKNNIKNKFYINSIDTICINDFKKKLFQLIQDDIFNKIFKGIKDDDFEKNPILYHKEFTVHLKKHSC